MILNLNQNKMVLALVRAFNVTLLTILLACISNAALAQSAHVNPWAPTELGPLPPVASLTEGVWLKGDLHLHSDNSKDASNNSVAKIIAFAKSVGMGYICITDHDNHVNGDVAHHTWTDPGFKSDSVLLLYGGEWTTTRGHGNAFSARPYDHQRLYDVRDQRDIVIQAVKKELGIHLSANHPSGKDHFGFSYDMVESIEVWNSAIWSKNANAIMIWDDMLSSGRKLTGRGGSDSHHGTPDSPDKATKNTYQAKANYVGTPTTWVFAKTRTTQAVVDALTNGRVSVSANPYDPRVEFYADLDQDGKMDMMMGDNVKSTGKPVKFRVQLSGKVAPDATYTIKVVKNGDDFSTLQMSGKTPVVEFTDTPAISGRTYYRVTVEGPQNAYPEVPNSMALSGNMVGLSNPIYFNFDPNF
ncbi:PHP domain-containing protein [Mucilaginibacter frigoritolerans]|uniref:PHP domain-containing protein n=1 Tax=Mucilaginibacter frigoritolerans TaxID=652788 RepID=A0A562TQ76_9SPHI|nr:CehA/McbA family metallohydrolase [Mucilaginibacter frigoritolerans]TWI95593.1 PHP domain-containing protein [Mucilaginibacter frigoritolerans]